LKTVQRPTLLRWKGTSFVMFLDSFRLDAGHQDPCIRRGRGTEQAVYRSGQEIADFHRRGVVRLSHRPGVPALVETRISTVGYEKNHRTLPFSVYVLTQQFSWKLESNAYASHCTSFGHSGTTGAGRRRSDNFVPCAFLGMSEIGGSYRCSGLSV
jgi:hypothetical protein